MVSHGIHAPYTTMNYHVGPCPIITLHKASNLAMFKFIMGCSLQVGCRPSGGHQHRAAQAHCPSGTRVQSVWLTPPIAPNGPARPNPAASGPGESLSGPCQLAGPHRGTMCNQHAKALRCQCQPGCHAASPWHHDRMCNILFLI